MTATPVLPPDLPPQARAEPMGAKDPVLSIKCGCAWNAAGEQVRHCGNSYSLSSLEREAHNVEMTKELVRGLLELRGKLLRGMT